MPQNQLTYIKSDNLINSFKQHIDDELNERILFSAPFGAGKSTFLKNFFDETNDYIVFKLYPVNYSVAPNQDVFEIVKYELLYELLNRFPNDIELNQEQFSMLLITQMFFLNQMKIDLPLKLLAKASSLVPGATAANETIINALINTTNSFKEYKKDVNKNEFDLLNEHIRVVQSQKGHIYESDEITQLIISLIDRVKAKKVEGNSKVKTVLLIDDLDRLDPEHVFRLFNVFSAHYDDVTESNKFYFDKVIFVCDIKNVREMFNHRCGFNVEFTGYIDKFYSSEVFNFDFKKYLKESLPTLLNPSLYQPYKYFISGSIRSSIVERYLLKPGQQVFETFKYILKSMIDFNIIRIRNLRRFTQFTLPNNLIETKYKNVNSVQYVLLVILSNLEKLFIHQVDLESAFEFLYKNYKSNYSLINPNNREQSDFQGNTLIQYCLPFILDEKIVFGNESDENVQHSYPFKNEDNSEMFIIYTIHHDFENDIVWQKFIKCTQNEILANGVSDSPAILRPNPYWFLYSAYREFKARNY